MEQAASGPAAVVGHSTTRPVKLTVRLSAGDSRGLASAAEAMGMTPNAWVAAVIRHRLQGPPTLRRDHEVELIALRAEVRRIGVNVNQIARALNTAVMEGAVLDLELEYLDALRVAHIDAVGEAFAGNLAYWQAEP
jgi:multidrug efflux pump subunit AcrB